MELPSIIDTLTASYILLLLTIGPLMYNEWQRRHEQPRSTKERLSDLAVGFATFAAVLIQLGHSSEATWILIGAILIIALKNFWNYGN
jgi:hypothetical protein